MMTRSALLVCLLLPASAAAKEPFRFPAGKSDKAELKYRQSPPRPRRRGEPAEIGAGVGALALKPAQARPGLPARAARPGATWRSSGPACYRRQGHVPPVPRRLPPGTGGDGRGRRRRPRPGHRRQHLLRPEEVVACSAVLIEQGTQQHRRPAARAQPRLPLAGLHPPVQPGHGLPPEGQVGVRVGRLPRPGRRAVGHERGRPGLGVLEVFDIKIGEPHFDAKGVPYVLCLRRVLEKAKTIDEAMKVLEGMRRTTTINVAIADRDGVAVLEVTPERVVRRSAAARRLRLHQPLLLAGAEAGEADQPATAPSSASRRWRRSATAKEKLSVEDLRKALDAVEPGRR